MGQGRTFYGRNHAYAAISQLRSTWQRRVIEYKVNGHYPFSDDWDLSRSPKDRGYLDAAGLELVRAGRTLFSYLFCNGDDDLRKIANHLVEHTFREYPKWASEITVPAGQLTVGLNVDTSIDNRNQPTGGVRYIARLTQLFSTRTRTVVRDCKLEPAKAMKAPTSPTSSSTSPATARSPVPQPRRPASPSPTMIRS